MFQNCNFEGLNHETALAAYELALEKLKAHRQLAGVASKEMNDEDWKGYRAERLRLQRDVDQAESTWSRFLYNAPTHYALRAV